MRSWVRRYNYIQDYFVYLYEQYSKHYEHAHPVTYYSIDMENSVMDREKLYAGSYEKEGIGDLSGFKWKKIYMLPVFGLEDIRPNSDSGDRGLTFKESLRSTLAFPDAYGIKPLEFDLVDINYGIKSLAIKNRPLYKVSKIDIAHHGEFFQLYNCTIQVAAADLTELEKQISSYWYFNDATKSIIPLNNANFLIDLEKLSLDLSADLKNEFNQQLGFFLYNQGD